MACTASSGRLGVVNPSLCSSTSYNTSAAITEPLVALILQQTYLYPPELKERQMKARQCVHRTHRHLQSLAANEIAGRLLNNLRRVMELAAEKSSSSWLSTLLIAEHGFTFHKEAFRDAICLRYSCHPPHLPSQCVCGERNTIEHALSCRRGGFPSIRHNEIRDMTADLLSEVCHNVGTEPFLEPIWML